MLYATVTRYRPAHRSALRNPDTPRARRLAYSAVPISTATNAITIDQSSADGVTMSRVDRREKVRAPAHPLIAMGDTLCSMLMRALAAMFFTATLLAATNCASTPTVDERSTQRIIPASDLPTTDIDGRTLPNANRATVYLFVGPECPISRSYCPEIARISARDEARGISWIMIFSEYDISADVIRTFQREYSLPLPAVIDPTQKFACNLGAQIIPSVVVLDANHNVMYRGRIDDRYKGLGVSYGPPTKRDLADVVDAIADGHPLPYASTTAVGCVLPRCAP